MEKDKSMEELIIKALRTKPTIVVDGKVREESDESIIDKTKVYIAEAIEVGKDTRYCIVDPSVTVKKRNEEVVYREIEIDGQKMCCIEVPSKHDKSNIAPIIVMRERSEDNE